MDAVEEIKSRLSIEDVIGRYVDLKRSGSSYKGLCPFHQEKTPSFYVTPSRGTYHCFACSAGGDVFNFVMEMDKVAFPEALRRLADQAGVALPEREARTPSLKGRLYDTNEAAARFFRKTLELPQGEPARRYLQERGFGIEAIELFDLGYAPEGREALVQHLHAAGFDHRILLAAGLAVQDDIGGKLRDRFRGRLMFPIRDSSARIIGFGGRMLGEVQPKYLNSPQTEIFDKSSVLFGVHRAQDGMRQAGKAVLVEGYLDAIRAHLCGYTYTVASLGTAVTAQQLSALIRLTGTVILALDPDPAGHSAAIRSSLTALAEVIQSRRRLSRDAPAPDLRVAQLPPERGDPDELMRHHRELWEQALDSSIPVFEYYYTHTWATLDRSSQTWQQDLIDRILPEIQRFAGSAGWQAMWLQRLATETGIDPRALQRTMVGPRSRQRPQPRTRTDREQSAVTQATARGLASDPSNNLERTLLALLLKLVIIPTEAAGLLVPGDLTSSIHRAILEGILDWQKSDNYDYEMLRETLPEEVHDQADELHALDVPLPDEGKVSVAIAYHLTRLRHFRIQAQHARASQLLDEVDAGDRTAAVAKLAALMRERQEVERDLDRLSRLAVQAHTADQGTIDQDSGRL